MLYSTQNEKHTLLHRENLHSKSYYVWPTSLREGPFIKQLDFTGKFFHCFPLETHILWCLISSCWDKEHKFWPTAITACENEKDFCMLLIIFIRTVCEESDILITLMTSRTCQSTWLGSRKRETEWRVWEKDWACFTFKSTMTIAIFYGKGVTWLAVIIVPHTLSGEFR